MSESKEMKTQETQEMQARSETEAFLRPAVDIYEDTQGITLRADLPGVSRERLNIQVDGNTLTIEGQASIDMPEGMEALYADVRATRYQRSFTLSNELDTDKISAEMKDGVLTLKLPKRAELQPRKIQVSAG
jgi:HSP20 family molecular chaperone IbpA